MKSKSKPKKRGIAQPQRLANAMLLLFMFMLTTRTAAAPAIEFEKKTYDFGEIVAGDTAVCFFHFRNNGDSTLKILDMRTTCTCAIADLKKKSYEPGEKGTIKAIFYSRGYNYRGKITKSIFITTNIKEERVVRLALSGHVKRTWKCEPEKVDFGEIGDRTILLDSVFVSTESIDSIRVDSIITEPEQLTVSMVKHEGNRVQLNLKVETKEIKWRFIGVIRFFSNIPEAGKIIIPVYARVSEKEAGKKP